MSLFLELHNANRVDTNTSIAFFCKTMKNNQIQVSENKNPSKAQ